MGTIGIARRRVLTALAVLAATLLLWGASAHAAPPGNYTGSTSDGGSWVADLPADWNGTLLLYSHGYGTTEPSDAPDDDTKAALLARGYALAGSGLGPPTARCGCSGRLSTSSSRRSTKSRGTVLPHDPITSSRSARRWAA